MWGLLIIKRGLDLIINEHLSSENKMKQEMVFSSSVDSDHWVSLFPKLYKEMWHQISANWDCDIPDKY